MKKILLLLFLSSFFLTSCMENYSNGERIGFVTKFSQKGVIWKSWEGHLNLSQTGMNTAGEGFDFSLDNDINDANLVAAIDSAAENGWKVKLIYHETLGKNWFSNRGDTDRFVTICEVLDRNPLDGILNKN